MNGSARMHNTCALTRWQAQNHVFKASRSDVMHKETQGNVCAFPSTPALKSEISAHQRGQYGHRHTGEGQNVSISFLLMPLICFKGGGGGVRRRAAATRDSAQVFGTSSQELIPVFGLCVWGTTDVLDYHRGNTAGLGARWSSECVHTALRRTHLVPCTAEQILQDRWHHDWLTHVWSDRFGWFKQHNGVRRANLSWAWWRCAETPDSRLCPWQLT